MSSLVADPLDWLPHRPPFRFVSRLDSLEQGVRGTGAWVVRGDEEFFIGHFPGEPVVPGVLIGEALAQLSGIVGMKDGGGRLAQMDVRFRRAVSPPAEIALRSTLMRTLGAVTMYDVEASVGKDIIAQGTIVLGELRRT